MLHNSDGPRGAAGKKPPRRLRVARRSTDARPYDLHRADEFVVPSPRDRATAGHRSSSGSRLAVDFWVMNAEVCADAASFGSKAVLGSLPSPCAKGSPRTTTRRSRRGQGGPKPIARRSWIPYLLPRPPLEAAPVIEWSESFWESLELIRPPLDGESRALAYSYGAWSDAVAEYARAFGYAYGRTTDPGGNGPGSDLFALPWTRVSGLAAWRGAPRAQFVRMQAR